MKKFLLINIWREGLGSQAFAHYSFSSPLEALSVQYPIFSFLFTPCTAERVYNTLVLVSLLSFLPFQMLLGWILCDFQRHIPAGTTPSDNSIPRALSLCCFVLHTKFPSWLSKDCQAMMEKTLTILIKSTQIMELQTCLSQSLWNFVYSCNCPPAIVIKQIINSCIKKINNTCALFGLNFNLVQRTLHLTEKKTRTGRSCSFSTVGSVVAPCPSMQ